MGDDRGHPALAWLLEAFVAIVLVGTFVIYSNPGSSRGPATAPNEVARVGTRG